MPLQTIFHNLIARYAGHSLERLDFDLRTFDAHAHPVELKYSVCCLKKSEQFIFYYAKGGGRLRKLDPHGYCDGVWEYIAAAFRWFKENHMKIEALWDWAYTNPAVVGHVSLVAGPPEQYKCSLFLLCWRLALLPDGTRRFSNTLRRPGRYFPSGHFFVRSCCALII